MKKCSTCGKEKSFSEFHADKSSKTGFRSNCKTCCKESSAARYKKDPAKQISYARNWQINNPEKFKEYRKNKYQANPEKAKEIAKKYRMENPDKIKEYNAKKYASNPEAAIDRVRKYRAENLEKRRQAEKKYRDNNLEKVKAACKLYRENNRDVFKLIDQNRRARKINAGGVLSKGLADRLFKLQKGKCACCKKPLGDDYHMDHIMPLALGGTNTDDNIQLLRARCNLQKHAKHPVDFMRERGFLL